MLALWSCGRRASVVQAQRQIHRVLLAACTSQYRIRGLSPSIDCGLMPAEPHIRSPFSERLAPQSLILKVIGLGRVGPHCMAAYRSHCSRRSTRPDPAALGANALTEPTAESTVGLVSHPHPGKLDHCGAQTRIACLR